MQAPRRRNEAQARPDAAARAGEASRRVLIVEDDPALRTLYRFNLEASGIAVDEAPDGETALRMLAEGELPDVVLLDVMMPGIDGWTVAERLAADERTAGLPIVFVTARAEDASRVRGLALGAAAYLTKPFNPVLLAEEVERAIAGTDDTDPQA